MTQTITFSKVDHCPNCSRKLCKRIEVGGFPFIDYRHKGAEIVATDLELKCVGCGRYYEVTAQNGIVNEVHSGR